MVSDFGCAPLALGMNDERSTGTLAGEKKVRFDMIGRGDFVRPGCWRWRCRREDDAGEVAYGYVHADPLGLVIFDDTFEADR